MTIIEKVLVTIFMISFFAGSWLILWARFKESEKEAKCPKCGELWAAENLDEELIGIFRKSHLRFFRGRGPLQDSDIKMVRYGKYKLHHKCKYCGHQWTSFKSRNL